VTRGKLESNPVEIAKKPHISEHLYVSKNHADNWLDCIKTRKLPICDVAIGHSSATVCHLGNIALRTGKKVLWDPAKQVMVGDSETAAMVSKPYRTPWLMPKIG
jgi:hypothetical protein